MHIVRGVPKSTIAEFEPERLKPNLQIDTTRGPVDAKEIAGDVLALLAGCDPDDGVVIDLIGRGASSAQRAIAEELSGQGLFFEGSSGADGGRLIVERGLEGSESAESIAYIDSFIPGYARLNEMGDHSAIAEIWRAFGASGVEGAQAKANELLRQQHFGEPGVTGRTHPSAITKKLPND